MAVDSSGGRTPEVSDENCWIWQLCRSRAQNGFCSKFEKMTANPSARRIEKWHNAFTPRPSSYQFSTKTQTRNFDSDRYSTRGQIEPVRFDTCCRQVLFEKLGENATETYAPERSGRSIENIRLGRQKKLVDNGRMSWDRLRIVDFFIFFFILMAFVHCEFVLRRQTRSVNRVFYEEKKKRINKFARWDSHKKLLVKWRRDSSIIDTIV